MEKVKETLDEYDCILLAKMAVKSGPTQALRDFKFSRLIPGKDYVPLNDNFKPISRHRDDLCQPQILRQLYETKLHRFLNSRKI